MPPDPSGSDPSVLGALTATVTTTATTVAVMSNDVGHMREDFRTLSSDVKEAMKTLGTVTADAAASPAGRDVLRQLKAHDVELGGHGKRLDDHDSLIDEIRGAVRLIKSGGAVVGALAALASVLVILHTLGVI